MQIKQDEHQGVMLDVFFLEAYRKENLLHSHISFAVVVKLFFFFVFF